jgi:hypothetical protein
MVCNTAKTKTKAGRRKHWDTGSLECKTCIAEKVRLSQLDLPPCHSCPEILTDQALQKLFLPASKTVGLLRKPESTRPEQNFIGIIFNHLKLLSTAIMGVVGQFLSLRMGKSGTKLSLGVRSAVVTNHWVLSG